jgi:hypothetical protein
MIEEFSGVCSEAMSTLLDAYQMEDWKMSWKEFLKQFLQEMVDTIEHYQIDEEEE